MKILEVPSPSPQPQELPPLPPLINQGGEDTIYIGVGILAVVVVLVIGLLSRRVEYAIIAAVIIAAVLILLAVIT